MAKVLLLSVKENKVINTDEGIGAMDNTEGMDYGRKDDACFDPKKGGFRINCKRHFKWEKLWEKKITNRNCHKPGVWVKTKEGPTGPKFCCTQGFKEGVLVSKPEKCRSRCVRIIDPWAPGPWDAKCPGEI